MLIAHLEHASVQGTAFALRALIQCVLTIRVKDRRSNRAKTHVIVAGACSAAGCSPCNQSVTMKTLALRPTLLVVGDVPRVAEDFSALAEDSADTADIHVARRSDASQAARRYQPDAIIIEGRPSDPALLELCRTMQADTMLGGRPMFIVAPSRPRREDLLAALDAGVWHVTVLPLDIDELLLRIGIYVAARRDATRASKASLVDVESGLYNAAGLARRSRELSSEAARRRTDLAVVAIGADIGAASLPADAALTCGEILRNTGRPYDVIGRLGPTEFVVLAPATGSSGAARFARRLGSAFRSALMKTLPPGATVRVRAGFSALRTLSYTPAEPMELVSRAMAALRTGTHSPDLAWLPQSEIENRGPAA